MEIPAHRHRSQKLPGTNQWLQMGRHAFRPETPASPKVAISVRILIAAWTSPIPRQAPVPLPIADRDRRAVSIAVFREAPDGLVQRTGESNHVWPTARLQPNRDRCGSSGDKSIQHDGTRAAALPKMTPAIPAISRPPTFDSTSMASCGSGR